MSSKQDYVAVCADCCSQLDLSDINHVCLPMQKRRMLERLEMLMKTCQSGLGVLWLVRIIYRERCKMSGIEKYKDRAELARRVCALLEPDNA